MVTKVTNKVNSSQAEQSTNPIANRARREILEIGLVTGGLGLLGGASPAMAQSRACPFPSPGTPVPFRPPAPGAILPRRSAFSTNNNNNVRSLNAAYQEMRNLTVSDPSDPRGWMAQANVHCYYCSGGAHEIHGSWSFLAWHRCYLFMHERILGKLINDPNLRLVYWDWDTPNRNIIPEIFKTGPLNDPLRRAGLNDRIPANLVGPAAMNVAMRPQTFQGFGGDANSSGSLENNPHGPVHCWTSTDSGGCIPDMGVLATAARDPIFFAHHCNIDRLWDVWLRQPGRANPTDAAWLDMKWPFFDENKVWTEISVRDVLNYENNLRYSYECLEYSSARCVTGLAPRLAISESKKAIQLNAEPKTSSVSISPEFKVDVTQNQVPTDIDHLHIDGISVPSHKAALLRVFANMPDATAETSIDTPNFLGYVSTIPKVESEGDGHHHGKFNVSIDVSHHATELFAADDFQVTLVPVSMINTLAAKAHDISYDKIYLTRD